MGGVLVTQASLANQVLQTTCQSEVGQGPSCTGFRLGFEEELALVALRVVLQVILQGAERKAWASWEITTW